MNQTQPKPLLGKMAAVKKKKHEKTETNKSQTVGHLVHVAATFTALVFVGFHLTHVGLFLSSLGAEGIRYFPLCIPLLLTYYYYYLLLTLLLLLLLTLLLLLLLLILLLLLLL